ncbi:hypothetical protein AX17_003284 [Amanita inopinata Kibby_2008]|nr:hypothetical protein AX17_003284 [Amanita inopinata Kibby_2008]
MSTPAFFPTPTESALVNQIFTLFDTQKLGVLTGDVAIRAFAGAKLPPTVLGEIWNIADEDNKGWLSRKGVAIALRLMSWAQNGEKVSKDLLNKPGTVPTIEGLTPVPQQNTGLSLSSSPPPSPALPPLTAQDRAKFQSLFQKAGPQNGLITGEKAREIFLKSKLPNDRLLQIWNLADTRDRGALDVTDFIIGMYFIQAVMSGQLSVIPPSLPPGLYQQATGNPSQATIRSHVTGGSGSFSPISNNFAQNRLSTVQPQYTGQSTLPHDHVSVPSSSQKVPPNIPARSTAPASFPTSPYTLHASQSVQWDVTTAEKATADRFFDELDTHKHGYIEGDVAVPFMLKSNLPGEDLARVWDLADLESNGRLTRDGFAVVIHLIQKKLSGQELPATLPHSLLPPSMRINAAATSNVSPFSIPNHQRAPEPVNDLFSFDESPQTSLQSQPTGSLSTPQQQQHTGQKLPVFASPSRTPAIDPFNSSISASGMHTSKMISQGDADFHHFVAIHQDLLGDDDDDDDDGRTVSLPLHDKSAELGNAQNQLNSTNRSLEATRSDRTSVEQTLASQAAQLSALQIQLSSAKAAYETETKLLATLRERQTNQLSEIQKCREELIRAESDLSAVRVEKAEIEGAFLRDKEDARELHRKMVEVGQRVEALKQDLERIKKDSKQQKGLLAIARKQLSTKETERIKAEKELEEASDELTTVTNERQDAEAGLARAGAIPLPKSPERGTTPDSVTFAASQPLPLSSPELSSGRSHNPFERLGVAPVTSSPRSQSPFLPLTSQPDAVLNGSALASSGADVSGFDRAFINDEDHEYTPADAVHVPAISMNGKAGTMDTGNVAPKPQSVSLSSQADDFLFSDPDDERFVTPPTSAPVQSQASSPLLSAPSSFIPTVTQDGSIAVKDDNLSQPLEATVAASQFPPIEDFGAQFPAVGSPGFPAASPKEQTETGQKPEGHAATDLSTELKELDIEESDSEDSEDEVPLAELAKEKSKTPPPAQEISTAADKSTDPSKMSFDDIFGVTSRAPTESAVPPSSTLLPPEDHGSTKSPAVAPASPFEVSPASKQNANGGVPSTQNAASDGGVSAFDEALGIIPVHAVEADSSITLPRVSTGPQFSFEAAFDDDFDFASANTTTSSTTAPVPLSAGINSSVSTAQTQADDGFRQPATPKQVPQTTMTSDAKPLSFDEVFSGSGLLATNGSSFPSVSQENPPTKPTTIPADSSAKPFPSVAPTSPQGKSSPKGSAASPSTTFRSPSPPPSQRTKSPPRVSSPKPRPSTSSSKEEKTGGAPARHSKLSIRLPFGKKKKQQDTQPPPPTHPPTHLSAPREQFGSIRTISPVGEDGDVQPVKQLTSMGFNRTQAVDALERHGYDVQKALNALLGAQ